MKKEIPIKVPTKRTNLLVYLGSKEEFTRTATLESISRVRSVVLTTQNLTALDPTGEAFNSFVLQWLKNLQKARYKKLTLEFPLNDLDLKFH